MGRFNRNRSNKFSYFAEFLIIIAGIMVSFLLNEWRETSNTKEKKLVLLSELHEDLKADSLFLSYSHKFYKEMLRGHDSMLTFPKKKKFHPDSITMYLDYLVSYSPFEPSEQAYINLNNNPDLFNDAADTAGADFLIRKYQFIRRKLYKNAVMEWVEIDKNFVLNTTLPYLEKNAPFVPAPDFKSFDGIVYYEVAKDDHFKNIVKSGKLYKGALVQNYNLAISQITVLKAEIKAFLDQEVKKK